MNQDVVHKTFDLMGYEVTKLEFNYAAGILIADENSSIFLLIETRILLKMEGEETRIDPQKDAMSLSPLLNLLHKPTRSITFSSNGNLRLKMADDITLSVFKDELYDSWEATGTDLFADISMLCTPSDVPPWGE